MRLVNWSFNDKVALVTGAASGMGLATARAFAEAAQLKQHNVLCE
jgi:NAD(P)-dependent dehydrogenase (short-subunit alcohol dehydrogenase family)